MTVFDRMAQVLARDANLGTAATITPSGGSAQSCRVVFFQPQAPGDVLGFRATRTEPSAQIAVADYAADPRGATLAIGGESYTVLDTRRDDVGAFWTMDLRHAD